MAQDFSNLYLIVDWRDDVLMDFVDDLTLEHIEGQLLWEEAWHSYALDGVVVPFEEMDGVKEIAAKRLEYSEEIIEKMLKGKISEKKLSNVLSYSFDDIKPSWAEVIRYYEVAMAMYSMALEMRENVLVLLPKLPRLIHRSLFYGIPGKEKSGEYRKTSSIEDAGPGWGEQKPRGIMWEAMTAAALLQAGGDLVLMRHPEAAKLIKKHIEDLMKPNTY